MKAHRGAHLFKPVIETVDDEDSFITQHPLDLVAKGKMLKVPFMTGVVADEGLLPTIGSSINSNHYEQKPCLTIIQFLKQNSTETRNQ